MGGAAMALAYTDRRLTRDVGAIFAPKVEVYAAARVVAGRHGLSDDWLNDAVKGLLPGDDVDRQPLESLPGISWQVASPRYLLALKVAAARADRDADDIRALAMLCGLTTADEVLACAVEVFGARAHLLTPKSEFFIRELMSPS